VRSLGSESGSGCQEIGLSGYRAGDAHPLVARDLGGTDCFQAGRKALGSHGLGERRNERSEPGRFNAIALP
jgi:hypothetical protein